MNKYFLSFILSIIFISKAQVNIPYVPVSYGELVDKITILEIKSERILDPEKLKNIKNELFELYQIYEKTIGKNKTIEKLKIELKKINENLWDIEDAIRYKDKLKEFDQEFIKIAQLVYITNDKRCTVKREINIISGSYLIEEKSYEEYTTI